MARSFDGVNDWISNGSGIPLPTHGTNPFTVACWFRALSNAQSNTYISNGIAGENCGALLYEYVDNTVEFYGAPSGSDPRVSSGLTVADTAWHHIAYRKAASGAAEWAKYLDGTKTVINASISFNLTGTAHSVFGIGCPSSAGVFGGGGFCNCEVARFAVWNTAIADVHIEAMAKGMNPLKFKPTFYWELLGNDSPERSMSGALPLTVTGATKADHPRGVVSL